MKLKIIKVLGAFLILAGCFYITSISSNSSKLIGGMILNVRTISLSEHVCLLNETGELYTYGYNLYGQLGRENNSGLKMHRDRVAFDECSQLLMDNVESVATGEWITLILRKDNTLFACGNNRYGQIYSMPLSPLTPVEFDDRLLKPIELIHLEEIKEIYAGWMSTGYVDNDNILYLWGNNEFGQLGTGQHGDFSEETRDCVKVQPQRVMENVKKVEFGKDHTLILLNSGDLFACGNNYYGQLGNEQLDYTDTPIKIMENIVEIAAGQYSSYALTEDGELWGWGKNTQYQISEYLPSQVNTPQKIADDIIKIGAGISYVIMVDINGKCWTMGDDEYGQVSACKDNIILSEGVTEIYPGDCSIIIKKNDGSLWGWGKDNYGQLNLLKQNLNRKIISSKQ